MRKKCPSVSKTTASKRSVPLKKVAVVKVAKKRVVAKKKIAITAATKNEVKNASEKIMQKFKHAIKRLANR